MRTVFGHAQINVVDDPAEIAKSDSPKGKPFLRLTLPDGAAFDITTNLAEMIGGVGGGVRKRWEDLQSTRGSA